MGKVSEGVVLRGVTGTEWVTGGSGRQKGESESEG